MKREIEFRGQTAKGEWVYGYYVHNTYAVGFAKEPTLYENHYIYSKNFISEKWFNTAKVEVIPETVGQYTGIKDKNGKKIYVGDIVWGDTIEGDWHKGVVEYNEDVGCFYVNAKNFMQYEKNSDSWSMLGCWTVEGNIFDKESDNGD